MVVEKHEAFVLNKIPYGDADWIVTLFSADGVKFSAFAPSGRSSRKRFAGNLDLFNLLEVVATDHKREGLSRLKEADLVTPMVEVRKDLFKFAAACYFSEMILHFAQERDRHPALYELFASFLASLNRSDPLSSHMIPLMEDRFLSLLGFEPELKLCLVCSKRMRDADDCFFHGMKGGLLCSSCLAQDKAHWKERVLKGKKPVVAEPNGAYPLSYGAIKKLVEGRTLPPKAWNRLQWSPEEVSQTRRALEYFIQYTVGKPFKSLQFLSHVAT